jgi:hypothetical protein
LAIGDGKGIYGGGRDHPLARAVIAGRAQMATTRKGIYGGAMGKNRFAATGYP